MENKWIDVWYKNYRGESDIAKECIPFIKATYKGDPYLPWAFMERALYTVDPNAELKYLGMTTNEYQLVTKTDKAEAITTIVSPMVSMQCTCLGKTMVEEYPIQDNDYSAPRAINQNLINKAIQRAKARLISKITGIGWSIYEKGDLQYDDKGTSLAKPLPKVETSKPTPKVENTPKEEKPNLDITDKSDLPFYGDDNYDKVTLDIVELIKNSDKEKMDKVLLSYNTSLIKSYGFALSTDDGADKLKTDIEKIKNKDKFLAGLKRLLNA